MTWFCGEKKGLEWSSALPWEQHRDSDNKHNKDTASCLALAMMRFSIICLWRESVCNGGEQSVRLQIPQWHRGTKSDQGPISYPFSDVYHSSRTPVEQSHRNDYPKPSTDHQENSKLSPPATACSQLSFSALLDLPHFPKGTKTKQPSHNPLSDSEMSVSFFVSQRLISRSAFYLHCVKCVELPDRLQRQNMLGTEGGGEKTKQKPQGGNMVDLTSTYTVVSIM